MNDARHTSPDFWDQAAAYAERAHPFTRRFAERAWEEAKLPPGSRVIDVATGVGALAVAAGDGGAEVLATDFSEGMVRSVAALAHPNIEARQMDGHALDVPDASFDAAFSMFGVMLFADWRAGLREMGRVVRSGGTGCVGTWKDRRGAATTLLLAQVIAKLFPEVEQPELTAGMTAMSDPRTLGSEMERVGFREVRIVEATHDYPVPPETFGADSKETQFSGVWQELDPGQQQRVIEHIRAMRTEDGILKVPSTALIAIGIKR